MLISCTVWEEIAAEKLTKMTYISTYTGFATKSKVSFLCKKEEPYPGKKARIFAGIEVCFSTRSGILVALTVMEIFTIEIVYYTSNEEKSLCFAKFLS